MKAKKIISSVVMGCLIIQLAGCGDYAKKDSGKIKSFTSFFAVTGADMDEGNEVQDIITKKIGAECKETWLDPEKNPQDVIGEMILSNSYPDFLFGGTEHKKLVEAGAFIPLDEYWDEYKNIKDFYSESEWNRIRSDDGHIYMIPQFSNVYMKDTATEQDAEAFWIQVKVLQWGGYPELTTLDEYFDLLERYVKANPTAEDGTANIGYEILSDGFMFFCLENPPQFLDGYPNDGCCIVDAKKLEAVDYNITDTAKRWFKKLNEEYKKGLIDPDCFVQTTDQYHDKIKTGNVLGFVDQYWSFRSSARGLPDECKYVPLGIVIDEGIEEHYRSLPSLDVSQGLGITTSCTDIEGALKFMNDLLDPEIQRLRFWGEEGKDYLVDDKGVFYRTDEQIKLTSDSDYVKKHLCDYGYFPHYLGMDRDGINAYHPDNQPADFYNKLSDIMKECFSAYGVQTFTEFLNQAGDNAPWYPMWTYTNSFTASTPYGKAKENIDKLKREYLPKIVMSEDFEAAWTEYMKIYSKSDDVEIYFDELTAEIKRRAEK